jgi:cell division protein FtsB
MSGMASDMDYVAQLSAELRQKDAEIKQLRARVAELEADLDYLEGYAAPPLPRNKNDRRH